MITYGTRIDGFDLGRWGKCQFSQWLHPQEGKKEFSERQIDWLAQFIKPGDSCVDVGAYNGDTALPMAVAAGPEGEVIAYEPNKVTCDLLKENALLNPQFAPIKVRQCAIGLGKGFASFKYDETRMNGGTFCEGEKVKVRTEELDTPKYKGRVAFVKIDTEGYDGVILSHYMPFLRENKSVVQVERYPHLNTDQCALLWNSIVEYGVPFIEGDWDRTPLTSLPPNLINIVITPHV